MSDAHFFPARWETTGIGKIDHHFIRHNCFPFETCSSRVYTFFPPSSASTFLATRKASMQAGKPQ
jgi:hypothetical protein